MSYKSIGKGLKLEAITARQFMLLNAAFFAAFGIDLDVNWATRETAEQVALLNKYYVRTSIPTGKRWDGSWWKKKYKGAPTVATPRTSRHELGFAADVESFRLRYKAWSAWIREYITVNGKRMQRVAAYGFKFNVSGEDWHIDRVLPMYITSGKQRALGTADTTAPEQGNAPGIPLPPINIPTEDDDMIYTVISHEKSEAVRILAPNFEYVFPTRQRFDIWKSVMVEQGHKVPAIKELPEFSYNVIREAHGLK